MSGRGRLPKKEILNTQIILLAYLFSVILVIIFCRLSPVSQIFKKKSAGAASMSDCDVSLTHFAWLAELQLLK